MAAHVAARKRGPSSAAALVCREGCRLQTQPPPLRCTCDTNRLVIFSRAILQRVRFARSSVEPSGVTALTARSDGCERARVPIASEVNHGTLHIEHEITDFASWKAAFDRFADRRREAGVTGTPCSLSHTTMPRT